MDTDIQFGDLEESRPEVKLRPDQNKHFAVVPFEAPRENDLPIFVELDVMRDMEAHALEDTSVELGGVLLGGQYEDEDGNEFVVVTDSLRAQHYEATKGSFKFTHDTWEQISRERDEFPDDLQMVGWYHTHPDWGVFLSGMDMFICDNFFNKPLDLALVIDPCRGDRGMFMWTGNPHDRIRRTGGFYFMASRHRREELELFTCQLEGKLTMPDSRFNPVAGHVGASSAPVVNLHDSRNNWQALAVVGMLTLQFFVLCMIAWKIIAPVGEDEEGKEKVDQLAGLERKIERLSDNLSAEASQQAEERILDHIVAHIAGEMDISERMKEYDQIKRKLLSDADESQRLADLLRDDRDDAKELAEIRKNRIAKLEASLKSSESDIAAVNKKLKERGEELKDLQDKYKKLANDKGADKDDSLLVYITIGMGTALLFLIIGVVFLAATRRGIDDSDEDDDADQIEFNDPEENEPNESEDKDEE